MKITVFFRHPTSEYTIRDIGRDTPRAGLFGAVVKGYDFISC